ncbi:hypothetical protein HD554DRAFT_2113452, partial [Boletus coccyginus]
MSLSRSSHSKSYHPCCYLGCDQRYSVGYNYGSGRGHPLFGYIFSGVKGIVCATPATQRMIHDLDHLNLHFTAHSILFVLYSCAYMTLSSSCGHIPTIRRHQSEAPRGGSLPSSFKVGSDLIFRPLICVDHLLLVVWVILSTDLGQPRNPRNHWHLVALQKLLAPIHSWNITRYLQQILVGIEAAT